MFDAELYREKSEVDEWKKRDPITQFVKYLQDHRLITDEHFKEIELNVEGEVNKAVEFAEAGTREPVESLGEFVYTEPENLR